MRILKYVFCLQLVNGFHITDKGLGVVAKHCTALKKIDLSACLSVTDSGIISLVDAREHEWTSFILCGCNVDDIAVLYIVMKCVQLEVLSLEDWYVMSRTEKSCYRLTKDLSDVTVSY